MRMMDVFRCCALRSGFLALLAGASLAIVPSAQALEAVDDGPMTLVWLSSSAGSTKHPQSGSVPRYQSDSSQLLVGVDHAFSEVFGVSVAAGRGRADVNPVGQEDDHSKSTDWRAALRYSPGAWLFGASVFHRDYRTDRARVVALPVRETVQRVVLDARIDSTETGIELSASRSFDLDATWWLAPVLAVSYVWVDTGDFLEQAGARTVFEVDTRDENSAFVALGLTGGGMFFAGDWVVMPGARAGVEVLVDGDQASSTATLAGTRYGYLSEGYEDQRTRLSVGAGVAFRHLRGLGLRADFDHDRQSGYRQSQFSLGIEYHF